MRNESSGSMGLIAFAVVAIGILTVMGVVGSYYSGSLREAQAANECSVDADCGPCQECKDKYPDKPFTVLGCVDVCAAGEECIDGDCCPAERVCDDVCCAEGEYCFEDQCIECDPDEQPNECHECESGEWEWECEEKKGTCATRSGCNNGECVYEPDNDCCPEEKPICIVVD